MFQSILHRILIRRHFWRYASFSELSELYASRALRMLALNMIAAFAALYLYQNGYSVAFIAFYYASYFYLRTLTVVPMAYFIARYGPKHSILVSNFTYVAALLVFAFVPQYGIYALVGYGVLQALSATLYDLSHEINFSKITHNAHAGKEIGFMNSIEKIAAGLSPLIGGVIAYLFGPQVTIVAASILFATAAIPLLRSAEPVKTHQHLTFIKFPYKLVWRQMIARSAVGFDTVTSGGFWSLFIVIAVLGTTSNAMYALIGAFSSITLFAALIISHAFGKLIDNNKGRNLLRYATILDMATHLLRPFVSTPVGVVFTNVINEAATTGYAMPFMRGMFDMTDRLAGFRIAYLCITAISINFGSALAATLLGFAVLVWGAAAGMHVLFVVAAFIVLLIRLHGFPVYRK